MRKFKLLALLLLVFSNGYSQVFTVSGFVEDISTGERIIGAYVIDSISNRVSQSNSFGFYSFKNAGGKVSLHATFLGLRSESITVTIRHDTTINIKIRQTRELKEVVISSKNYNRSVNTPLGAITIPVSKLTSLPSLGETDILKAIQNQPGIKGGMEGSAGVFVRGGSGGENLFLLDDVPMYNVSHLYGFFSVFNSNAIKDVKIYRGGFPARYGGRASSVIDIRCLDGNNKSLRGELSLGFISSNLTLEGPLFNPNTTFIVSARRSYMELYSNTIKEAGLLDEDFPDYYFYDLNARISHTFSHKDKISIGFYKGKDKIRYILEDNITSGFTESLTEEIRDGSGWGNLNGSLRWNHTFGNGLFSNTTIAYSNYYYYTNKNQNTTSRDLDDGEIIPLRGYNSDYGSDITDFIVKTDLEYTLSNNSKLLFGTGTIFHSYNPGKSNYDVYDISIDLKYDTSFTNKELGVNEYYFYIESEKKVSEKININTGIRFSGLFNNEPLLNFEPRISASYSLLPNLVAKTTYSRMVQYMHLLSTSGLTMPTDIWVPALKGLKPLKSDQVDIGLAFTRENKFLLSVEGYRKWSSGTTDLRPGSSLFTEFRPWYEKTIQGTGKAWGVEFSFEKQMNKVSVNINYTLSRASRINPDLNNGVEFPFRYDRLHDLNLNLNYQLSRKWDFSTFWIYGTGYPVTLPVEKYHPALGAFNWDTFGGYQVNYYPSINNCRLPAYHRLDLGFHRKTTNRLGDQILSFDIFNAYCRLNPVGIYPNYSGFEYSTLLPIIPTITYSLKFK